MSEREDLIERLFHRAAELAPENREGFLAENCLDESIRAEVLELLGHMEINSMLDQPLIRLAGPGSLTDPKTVGPYRVRERLGDGGYGVVYVAEQTSPMRRLVALKLIKAGMDTDQVLARFEAERQALALMDHPNIARVLDAGATELGRPYFVMELVRGEPITDYCDRNRLGLKERLNLFIDVCLAVQHAHQKGVLHRDVKPSNVLVTLLDGHPVPKVIDFGIAKATANPLTERTLHTVQGELVGTPDYMSPEQADPMGMDVDTTTDVYSLGVLLYELLTGHLPFEDQDLRHRRADQVHRILRETDPSRPSTHFPRTSERAAKQARARGTDPYHLARMLRGDLDWIVIQALEKDRTRRYQTALELARDVRRYLDDDAVQAGPPRRGQRMKKFVRRHRVAFTAGTTVFMGLIIAAAGLTYSLMEARRQQERTRIAYAESEAVTDFLTEMLASADPIEHGQDVTVRSVLDQWCDTLEEEFRERPLLQARLHHTVGATYRELGEFDEADKHLSAALRLRAQELDPRDELLVASQYEMGVLERHRGNYEEARTILEKVVEQMDATLGPEDPAAIDARYELGSTLLLMERNQDAAAVLERGLELAETTHGARSSASSRMLSSLGITLRSLSRMEEAEVLLQRGLALDRSLYGDRHINTVAAKQNLGGLYRELGRYEEALPLFESSTATAVAILGDEHPTAIRHQSNLALQYSDMGRYRDAEPLSERVVELRRRILGDDNPSTLASRLNLALLYRRLERWDDATREAKETLAASTRTLGPDHLYTFIALGGLGESLAEQGEVDEALRLLDRAVRDGRRILSPEHWRVGVVLTRRAKVFRKLNQLDRAEDDLLSGIGILEDALGPDHDNFKEAVAELMDLYDTTGRARERSRWESRL